MKKRFFASILFLVGFVICAFAQSDPQAKAILNGVSKKFRTYNIVKSQFTLILKNPQANVSETQSGILYVKPASNKYKATIGDQELISDGKLQWTYLKKDNEVQISEVDNSPNALNPAQIFTMYEKGFKYVYVGDTKANGKIYQNLELVPLQTRSFSKVKLRIDKSLKQIASMTIYDKNGSVYSYIIKSFTPNVQLSDTFFKFDAAKHPGVDVVDLR